MILWLQTKCTECGEDNWLYLGEWEDLLHLARLDIKAVTCWSCGEVYFTEDCFSNTDAEETEYLIPEEGRESPEI